VCVGAQPVQAQPVQLPALAQRLKPRVERRDYPLLVPHE
jgi:hypothetical protein